MAEGDNLVRIADGLRAVLVGRTVARAGGRLAGRLAPLVGDRMVSVEARGKHLLIGFGRGRTLHTHLGLHGSWHRYRAGQRWRLAAWRAGIVLETADMTAVCFDPATVEVIETRALPLHPVLASLGPDAATADFDAQAALRRLRHPARARMVVGDALLDQSALAGVGNVYRSEVCFIERVHPFAPLADLDDETLLRVLERASALLRANLSAGPRRTTAPGVAGNLYVSGRTGRPCRRCGTPVASNLSPAGRRAYWCPRCQPV